VWRGTKWGEAVKREPGRPAVEVVRPTQGGDDAGDGTGTLARARA
jgi:hypothetical protein